MIKHAYMGEEKKVDAKMGELKPDEVIADFMDSMLKSLSDSSGDCGGGSG